MEIQISDELFEDARTHSIKFNRTIDEQIEIWMRSGILLESLLSDSDIEAILDGKSKLIVFSI